MPFEKGRQKTGGRKANSQSPLTDQLKERIKNILLDELSTQKWALFFDSLDSKDKVSLINKLLDLTVPKTVEIAESPSTQNFFEGLKADMYASFVKKTG